MSHTIHTHIERTGNESEKWKSTKTHTNRVQYVTRVKQGERPFLFTTSQQKAFVYTERREMNVNDDYLQWCFLATLSHGLKDVETDMKTREERDYD